MNNDDMAKQRFFLLSAIRLLSIAIIVVAMPRPAGAAFAVFGLLEFVFLPLFLARKWKTPDK
jgi:hypothetical protein